MVCRKKRTESKTKKAVTKRKRLSERDAVRRTTGLAAPQRFRYGHWAAPGHRGCALWCASSIRPTSRDRNGATW